MPQILSPPKEPRTKRVTFAGGFLPWQDPGGLRTEVHPILDASFPLQTLRVQLYRCLTCIIQSLQH